MTDALVRHKTDLNCDNNAQKQRFFEQGSDANVRIDGDECVTETKTDDGVGARKDGRYDNGNATLHDNNTLE